MKINGVIVLRTMRMMMRKIKLKTMKQIRIGMSLKIVMKIEDKAAIIPITMMTMKMMMRMIILVNSMVKMMRMMIWWLRWRGCLRSGEVCWWEWRKKDEEDTDEPGDNNDEDDGDGKNVKLLGTVMTWMKIEMKRVKMMKVMMNDENNDK